MKIEHIALLTTNLERLKDFYIKYFGALASARYTNPKKKFSSYFLQFEDGARLELMHTEGFLDSTREIDSQPVGYIHIAISAGSENEVNRLTEQLRADGYKIMGEPRLTGDGYYESVVLDPDGNRIELTV